MCTLFLEDFPAGATNSSTFLTATLNIFKILLYLKSLPHHVASLRWLLVVHAIPFVWLWQACMVARISDTAEATTFPFRSKHEHYSIVYTRPSSCPFSQSIKPAKDLLVDHGCSHIVAIVFQLYKYTSSYFRDNYEAYKIYPDTHRVAVGRSLR